MAKKIKLPAKKRKTLGRKVKNLREQGFIPANLYGSEVESVSLKLDANHFWDAFEQAGETSVIRVILENEKKPRPVLIDHIQEEPISGDILHVSFRQINLQEKVQASVPIELVGEAPAENKGGVIVQMMTEVEIEALPEELPEKLEVDISELEEIDQTISLNDLDIDEEKMRIIADDLDRFMVKVEEPTEEEEEEVEEEVEEIVLEGEEAEAAPEEGEETQEEQSGQKEELQQ
jgi:large subunit ribosomal protein L25